MLSPFYFGKVAREEYFTNRDKERELIQSNILSGINCVILSPRRWGKSSLVEACISEIKATHEKIVICKLDLFKIHSEEEFYEAYLKEVIKGSTSKWEEWMELSKQFLKSITPSISFNAGSNNDVSISFKVHELPKSKDEILQLPEKIALKKKIKFVICIDEFQNINKFQKPIEFQEHLRATFQYFEQTSFILYGSKRHIMNDLFGNVDRPFYKFGEIIFLKKIDTLYWEKYIIDRFASTNKQIEKELASQIAHTMKNHPYFVQQLSNHIWLNTKEVVDDGCIERGFEEMLEVNEIMYIREIENLTLSQISFLKAIINGEEQFTSQKVINGYNLGSSGNIKRIKEALANKEIIDFLDKEPLFNDPSFEIWLKQNYFQ